MPHPRLSGFKRFVEAQITWTLASPSSSDDISTTALSLCRQHDYFSLYVISTRLYDWNVWWTRLHLMITRMRVWSKLSLAKTTICHRQSENSKSDKRAQLHWVESQQTGCLLTDAMVNAGQLLLPRDQQSRVWRPHGKFQVGDPIELSVFLVILLSPHSSFLFARISHFTKKIVTSLKTLPEGISLKTLPEGMIPSAYSLPLLQGSSVGRARTIFQNDWFCTRNGRIWKAKKERKKTLNCTSSKSRLYGRFCCYRWSTLFNYNIYPCTGAFFD